jgi:hypothetical protein
MTAKTFGEFKKMLRTLQAVSCVLLLASFPAIACERSFDGTWISDASASMTYIRTNSKLEPKVEAFLSTLLGHMTMTFANGMLDEVAPDIEVEIAGKKKPFAGFKEHVSVS